MSRFSKIAIASLMLSAGLFTTAFAADAPMQATTAPSDQAMTCTMCETTWVKVPIDNGKHRIVGYTWGKKMPCSDCMDAVQSFLNTGTLQHTCKMCGGSMVACEAHPQ